MSNSLSKLLVVVSVDFEGMTVENRHFRAFNNVRNCLPNIPLTLFLNPGYFLGKDQDSKVKGKIQSLFRDGDELGLHVHGLRKLIERSGVVFNEQFFSYYAKANRLNHSNRENEGYEAILEESYSAEQLVAIFKTSREVLAEAGFHIGPAFRAGGWMAGEKVLSAMRQLGFTIDSSAVAPQWIRHSAEDDSLTEAQRYATKLFLSCVEEYWSNIDPTTQPFQVGTIQGSVLEMPNTGCLADYVTTKGMIEHLRDLANQLDGRNRFACIGFHDSTVADYGQRIIDAVQAIQADSRIEFATISQAAERTGLLQ